MQIDNAIVTPTNTHIMDSCMVKSKADIRAYLEGLREASAPEMAVNQRDIESQICEWRSHNFFYRMHVFRSRTKDVDLELKQTWYRELFCRVVSFFYFGTKTRNTFLFCHSRKSHYLCRVKPYRVTQLININN